MAAFIGTITKQGRVKLTHSIQEGTEIVISKFAVGSGSAEPSEEQTALQDEKYRANVASYKINDTRTSITFYCVVPADVGDFEIREIGLFDNSETLIAVGETMLIQKIASRVSLTIEFCLELSGSANITINVEPSTDYATQQWVDDNYYARETADARFVNIDGDETISGAKTFKASPQIPTLATTNKSKGAANSEFVQNVVTAAQNTLTAAINKKANSADVYTKTAADARFVNIDGNESIAGTKTFTGNIVATAGSVTAKTQATTDNSTKVATTAYVKNNISSLQTTLQNNINLKANSADVYTKTAADARFVNIDANETLTGNITFKGSVTATTQATTDSSQKVATTAFVKTAVSAAQTTLNTAINKKANSADVYTKTDADSRFVNVTGNETIAGNKTFTGDVIAKTQATTDNSTKVATTAFVKNAVSQNIQYATTIKRYERGSTERVVGTEYTNSTGKNLYLTIFANSNDKSADNVILINGVEVAYANREGWENYSVTTIVPPSMKYKVTGNGDYTYWIEIY